jgi:cold-inducible RNA-binding protein
MNTRLHAGNIPFRATEEDLEKFFAQCGGVAQVEVATDRRSGTPRGYAFVVMESSEAAEAAVQQLNGKDFLGRRITVAEAHPSEQELRRTERHFWNA